MSAKIVPARLNFLSIFSPILGNTDATRKDQIVFFYKQSEDDGDHPMETGPGKGKSRANTGVSAARTQEDVKNEQLRQVGLAQGMVEFARNFSDGAVMDSVETEKHRIVLTELEEGWWILASVHLTRLTRPSEATAPADPSKTSAFEYSTREVSPPALLLQQLRRAYRLFLLHHGPSLSGLFVRAKRGKFCSLVHRFWSQFARHWDVLLHGNPTVEVYGGIKLAAGGELGMGVGEEDWGSGEREVLEGLIKRTEGLVDLTVSRFREKLDQPDSSADTRSPEEARPWLGMHQQPGCADGLIFSGVGALTRESVRTLSEWAEAIYMHGEEAYGVKYNPNSIRRKRRRRSLPRNDSGEAEETTSPSRAGSTAETFTSVDTSNPPPSIITEPAAKASSPAAAPGTTSIPTDQGVLATLTDANTWVNVLTLGYRSWGYTGAKTNQEAAANGSKPNAQAESKKATATVDFAPSPQQESSTASVKSQASKDPTSIGHFVIGLKGDLDSLPDSGVNLGGGDTSDGSGDSDWTNRLSLRTLHLTVNNVQSPHNSDSSDDQSTITHGSTSTNRPPGAIKQARLRAVVYAYRPFIFTLLFDPNSSLLTIPSFFSTLHRTLSPLQPALVNSTNPGNVASRIHAALTASNCLPRNASSPLPISTLIHDPDLLTIHASLPNIPLPGTFASEGFGFPPPGKSTSDSAPPILAAAAWSRIDALHVHAHCLATYAATRRPGREGGGTVGSSRRGEGARDTQRTAKTTRGFGVVWMRLQATPAYGSTESKYVAEGDRSAGSFREAILVRRSATAGDGGGTSRKSRAAGGAGVGLGWSRFALGFGGGAEAEVAGATGELTEGLGVDARRYVESLLSLSR